MKLSTLLLSVATALTSRVEELGGSVEVFITPEDALKRLEEAPGKFRVLLGYGGGEAKGDYRSLEVTKISCILQAARGLSFDAAADALRGTTTNAPLLDVVESVRAWVRGLRFFSDPELTVPRADLDPQFGLRPSSSQWLGDASKGISNTRALLLTFTVERCLPHTEMIPVYVPNPNS